jgi:hypothetical protein
MAALSCWVGRRLSHDPAGTPPPAAHGAAHRQSAACAHHAQCPLPAGPAGRPQQQPGRLQAPRARPARLTALVSVEQSQQAEPEQDRRLQAVPCAAARPDTDSPCASGCLACAVPGNLCRARAPDAHTHTHTHTHTLLALRVWGPLPRLAQPWLAGCGARPAGRSDGRPARPNPLRSRTWGRPAARERRRRQRLRRGPARSGGQPGQAAGGAAAPGGRLLCDAHGAERAAHPGGLEGARPPGGRVFFLN